MTTTATTVPHPAADLLAALPYQLGFHPAESAVLVQLSPGGATVDLVARIDLAALDGPDGPAAAEHLLRPFRASAAGPRTLVLYRSAPAARRRTDDRLARAVAVLGRLAGDVETWVVGEDGWGHRSACRCCAPDGRSLTELRSARTAAHMVLAGRGAAPTREALAVDRAAPTADAVLEGVRSERRRLARAGCDPHLLRLWRRTGARLWDRVLAADTCGPVAAGRLAVAWEDKTVRDAVVAATMAGAGTETARYLDQAALARVYDSPEPPDGELVPRVVELVARVAALAPRGTAGPALGLLAYLCWWDNQSARADVVARQALAEDPAHRLAGLVVAALEAAVPPAWVHGPVQS